jgi:hypothetical protein
MVTVAGQGRFAPPWGWKGPWASRWSCSSGSLGGGARGCDGWTLAQCVSVDPGCSTVPVSPHGSLAREGTSCPRDPWNVAFEHVCQFSVSSALPETRTLTMDSGRAVKAGRLVGGGGG